MSTTCPVCGQTVQTLDAGELQKRISELASPMVREERQKLERETRSRIEAERRKAEQGVESRLSREYERKLAKERESAKKEIEKSYGQKLDAAEKRAIEAEQHANKREDAIRTELQRKFEKQNTTAVRQAMRDSEKRIEKLARDKETERLRHEAENARLQDQLTKLTRKLESQSGEELGEDGERDLAVLLRQEFPGDRIERIGRGVKGADIIHHIMDGSKLCGRIIYESKNVSQWNNSFVAQAEKYRTQYETPYVVIVSNVFPRKEKSICICEGIPVVSLRSAVPLATILREGVVEIGRIRTSEVARDEKSRELFEYVVSDRFRTRFAEVAASIEDLRDQQRKEKTWHENAWEARSQLHEKLESRHREIGAQIRSITHREARVLQLAAKA